MDAIMPRKDFWTKDDKKVVRDYWMAGHSALWIGNKLGKTRNSIAGLVARMGLMRTDRSANPHPIGNAKRYTGRKATKPLFTLPIRAVLGHRRSDGKPPNLTSVALPVPSDAAKRSFREEGKITMAQLRSNSCRWPLGDPQHEDFGYCGAHTDGLSPYCAIHTKIAYHTPQRRV